MKIHPACFDTDVWFAALPCWFFAQSGVQPLPDGFSFSDAFWLNYDDRMTRVLLIVLGLILAQVLVFFIASCFAGSGFHNRKTEPRHRTANSGCSGGTQKG